MLDVPGDRTGQPGTAATLDGGPGSLTLQASRNVFATAQWTRGYHGVRGFRGFRPSHLLTAGADVRHERATIDVFTVPDYRTESRPSALPADTLSTGRAITTAAFAQDQITLTDRAGLTLGVRYDHWRTYDAASQAAAGLAPVAFDARGAGALTGKAALVYRVAASTVVRTSVGTSFRSPTVFDLYRDLRLSSGQLLLGNPELEPERLTAWEVGARHGVRQDAFGGCRVLRESHPRSRAARGRSCRRSDRLHVASRQCGPCADPRRRAGADVASDDVAYRASDLYLHPRC